MSVLQFPDRRTTVDPDALLVCECGSAWFELYTTVDGVRENGTVILNARGNVTGYTGIPHCTECGRENLP